MILVADRHGLITMASSTVPEISTASLLVDDKVTHAPVLDDRGDAIGTVFILGERIDRHARSLADRVAVDASHLMQLDSGDHARPLDLHRVVADVAALRSDLDLEIVVDSRPLMVTIHEPRIVRVLINLIDNAVDAGTGKIMFAVRRDHRRGHAIVEVIDTGTGIAPGALRHIFEPFFTTKDHGTGLGLTLARAVVERYGGTLTFTTTLGVGTTFTLDLPMSAPR